MRVLNPSRGTFHPKIYLARRGEEVAVALGSANLTSGLVTNVEVAAVLRGHQDAPQIRRLRDLAELWWAHREAADWSAGRVPAVREVLDPRLLAQIQAALETGPTLATLGGGHSRTGCMR